MSFLVIWLFAAGDALANGVTYPGYPFWSAYVGNYWCASGSGGGHSWRVCDDVYPPGTLSIINTGPPSGWPGLSTYYYENTECEADTYDCSNWPTNWYYNVGRWFYASPSELRLWQQEFYNGALDDYVTVTVNNTGLLWLKNNMSLSPPNNDWTTTLTSGTVKKYYAGTSCPLSKAWGGDPSDRPVPGDYDGDGKTDIAVYEASTGAWYIKPSSGAAAYVVGWGGTGYQPVTK